MRNIKCNIEIFLETINLKNKLICIAAAAALAAAAPLGLISCAEEDGTVRINEVTHSVFYAPLYLA